MFVRDSPAPTVGLKYVGGDCMATRSNGRNCRGNTLALLNLLFTFFIEGKLKDFVLDWEDELPDHDLTLSDSHSVLADLSIVMGSTLQIIPAGNMPTYTKKYHDSGKLVICNLQPTKQDKKADLNIHTYVDDVMEMLMTNLGLEIPEYNKDEDPVKKVARGEFSHDDLYIDWTQDEDHAKYVKKLSDVIHDEYLRRKREEKKRKSEAAAIEKKLKMTRREEEEEEEEAMKEEKFDIPNIADGDSIEIKKENGSHHNDNEKNGRSCKKRDSYKFQDDDEDSETPLDDEDNPDVSVDKVEHERDEPKDSANGNLSGENPKVTENGS